MLSRLYQSRRTIEILCFLLAMTGGACADDPFIVQRVPLSGQPVLVFVEPTSNGPDRQEQLFLIAPSQPDVVHPVLTVGSNLQVVHRVDRAHFLLQTYNLDEKLWRIDLEHGTCNPVFRGEGALHLLAVRGDCGYFHVRVGQGYGYRVDPRDPAKFLRDRSWPKGPVCRFDIAGTAPASAIAEDALESVTELTETDAWGVTTSPDDHLTIKRIPLAGGAVQSVALPQEAGTVTFALSPSHHLVALGVGRHSSLRDLVIVDMDEEKIILRVPDISVHMTELSPNLADLPILWVDEQTLRFSEARPASDGSWKQGSTYYVDLEIPSGRRLREYRFDGLPFFHHSPPRVLPPKPASQPVGEPYGAFKIDGRSVTLKGSGEEVGESIDSEHVMLSPDHRWIAWRECKGGAFPQCLGDTTTGRVVRVTRPWGYGLAWLPEAR